MFTLFKKKKEIKVEEKKQSKKVTGKKKFTVDNSALEKYKQDKYNQVLQEKFNTTIKSLNFSKINTVDYYDYKTDKHNTFTWHDVREKYVNKYKAVNNILTDSSLNDYTNLMFEPNYNAPTYTGNNLQSLLQILVPILFPLNTLQLLSLNGIFVNIAKQIATGILTNGINFKIHSNKTLSQKEIDALNEKIERLKKLFNYDHFNVEELVKQSITQMLLWGQCFLYPRLHDTSDEELNETFSLENMKKGQLETFLIWDLTKVAVVYSNWVTPLKPKYFEIITVNVMGVNVDYTRFYQFYDKSVPITPSLRPAYRYGGQSIIQRAYYSVYSMIYKDMLTLQTMQKQILLTLRVPQEQIYEEVNIAITDVNGNPQTDEEGNPIYNSEMQLGQNGISKLEQFSQFYENFSVFPLANGDEHQREELDQIQYSLSGYSDILETARDGVSMAVPNNQAQLQGKGTSGFSNGESDLTRWSLSLKDYIPMTINLLNYFLNMIQQNEWGEIEDNIIIDIDSEQILSALEKSEIFKNLTSAVSELVQNGIWNPEVANQTIYDNGGYVFTPSSEVKKVAKQNIMSDNTTTKPKN